MILKIKDLLKGRLFLRILDILCRQMRHHLQLKILPCIYCI